MKGKRVPGLFLCPLFGSAPPYGAFLSHLLRRSAAVLCFSGTVQRGERSKDARIPHMSEELKWGLPQLQSVLKAESCVSKNKSHGGSDLEREEKLTGSRSQLALK